MEVRAQDKEINISNNLVYNPPNRESISSVGERRRDENNHRGSKTGSVFEPSQTLDHNLDPITTQSPAPISVAGKMPQPSPVAPASNSKPLASATIRYRECLKNHAASMGSHVTDGCGEFMPNGEEGTLEALKCAACDCHRNFHRKDIEGEPRSGNNYYSYNNSNKNINRRNTISFPAPPAPFMNQHYKLSTSPISPVMMAFGVGNAAESSSEDLNVFRSNGEQMGMHSAPFSSSLSKKRFRTKFSHEQKEKMFEFAEKVGWKIQKQDDEQVQQFCAEVGVKRQVFKVWMHNNKQAMKKKQV